MQEIGHDCTNWTPAVFYDLMRLGDGTGAALLLLLLQLRLLPCCPAALLLSPTTTAAGRCCCGACLLCPPLLPRPLSPSPSCLPPTAAHTIWARLHSPTLCLLPTSLPCWAAGEGVIAAYYGIRGWPMMLPSKDRGAFLQKVHSIKVGGWVGGCPSPCRQSWPIHLDTAA